MKKAFLSALVMGILSVFAAIPTQAAEYLGPERQSDGGTSDRTVVNITETHRNLYTLGGSVVVNGRTSGDLFVFGGTVNIEGETEKDLSVIGGNVYLNAPVGEDLRVAGGNVSINSRIGGDLLVAGGTVTISERAEIAGDLWIAGGSVVVNAPVKGEIKAVGGEVTLNGRVEKGVSVKTGERLVFGPKAQIVGKVFYQSPQEAVRQPGSQLGEVEYKQIEKRNFDRGLKALATGAFLIKLVAWFLAGWLLLHFRKNRVRNLAENIKAHPWEALGLGLAVLVIMPIVGVVLLFTFVGYYIGLIILAAYVITLILVNLLSALVLGFWLLPYLGRRENIANWQVALLGAVVWNILGLVPVVGWLAWLAIFLLTLGSVSKMIRNQANEDRI
jgi:hypothetical protein